MKQSIPILPVNDTRRFWVSIAITVVVSILLTIFAIYAMGDYGLAMFVFLPLYMGAGPTILYGYKRKIKVRDARKIAFTTLWIYAILLLIFAMEGLICIVMAAPIGLVIAWIGSLIGFVIVNKTPNSSPTAMLILIAVIPAVSFVEKDYKPALTSVVTSIEIDADLETVWQNVVEFPQLEKPEEFIFQTGIAYPVNAKVEGTGSGAVRHCNFTTGSFVEPVTVWDQPNLLAFDVEEQPAPMKELSFWDIDAPHLHDYFVSKKGQFKLKKLASGKTLLEGTTWYYHNIRPAFYWRLWSDYIIHKIHNRVLEHIKKNAENPQIATR